MSLAVTHVAVGATATALLVTSLVPAVTYPRVLVVVGGGWAMAVFASHLRPVHETHLADVFWLHRTLDLLVARDSPLVAGAAVLVLLVATAVAERRTYRALERLRGERE